MLSVITPALRDTALLTLGVVVVSSMIGVPAAWLVATYQFPGRAFLGWAVILPFAVPTYIAAYAMVEALDFFGPVQSAFRAIFGFKSRSEYWFPDLRSMPGAVMVMALVLYPYIYIASWAAFRMQGASLTDAARSLGCTRLEALRRVVLPVVMPAVAAGATLVLLETLNDIGASQYLGVNTLTVAIFTTWLIKGNLAGAAQIALVALVVVLGVLWLERALRNNKRFIMASRSYRPVTPPRLTGWQAGVVVVLLLLPIMMGFLLPMGILVTGALRQLRIDGLQPELTVALWNSVLSASIATLLVLGIALVIGFAHRFSAWTRIKSAVRMSGMGYALPGTVLVIGLLPALGWLDGAINAVVMASGGPRFGLILSGSIAAIVLAYVIRFLIIGIDQVETGLGGLSRNIDYAALTLGCTEGRLANSILKPALQPVLAGAAVLVFVDCLKELPATLLLRPLNFETLATHLYGHAARGSFEDGALAALLIVTAGIVPLLVMSRMIQRS
jgi:iron(III) transport system permease protein